MWSTERLPWLKKDSRMLAENGGYVVFTKDWAHYLLLRMGYVKRKANSKVKITVSNFEELKVNFLCDIKAIVLMEEIPSSLILNWDLYHHGQGAKKVSIAGQDDKRQITGVFTVTLDGQFLPPQLIYQGTTAACLPRTKFPADWHVTCSPNHWANEATTKEYIRRIINPYIKKKRQELKLADDHHALSPNCTDRLQPLDLSINKSAKDFLKAKFQQWYSDQIFEQQKDNVPLKPVTFPMHVMKPLGAQWLIQFSSYMDANPDIIRNGFRATGITDVLTT